MGSSTVLLPIIIDMVKFINDWGNTHFNTSESHSSMTPEEADASHMNLLNGEKVPLGSRRDAFNADIFSCKCVRASRRGREGRGQCVVASLKEKRDVVTNAGIGDILF